MTNEQEIQEARTIGYGHGYAEGRDEASDAAMAALESALEAVCAARGGEQSIDTFDEDDYHPLRDAFIEAAAAAARAHETTEPEWKRVGRWLEAAGWNIVSDDLLGEVAKVYCHVTGGRISKPGTVASAVIGEADEMVEKLVKDGIDEHMEDLGINGGVGCEACGWNADREQHMVTIEAVDGTPTVWADPCIADLVRALNAAGFKTVASCCGHRSGVRPTVKIEWTPPSGDISADELERLRGELDRLVCGAPSGWHDDGDPMVCVRRDGHIGRHRHPDLEAWNECGYSGPEGVETYSCILAEGHGGSHYDPTVDSSWPSTEANRFDR